MWKRILPLLVVASLADAQSYNLTTVAGGAIVTGQPATSYAVYQPFAVAVDSLGNSYVAIPDWCQIWVVNSAGILTQVIGNGTCGYSGDNGPAAAAQFDNPQDVAVDNSGNVYIADTNNNVIRKVSGGIITTVAGNGTSGFSGDGGSATSAQLSGPTGVGVDSSGNLYVADAFSYVIRKVSGGIITTVAGNGTGGFSGDGGSALLAELNHPSDVAVDSSGNLYIADAYNCRIRKVSGGIITTVAGSGGYGYNGDNISATSAELYNPQGIALDSSRNLYIADSSRIRKVSGGIITTVVGNGSSGYNGDNISAASAELDASQAIAVDNSGNLYIADTSNNRVRKVAGGIITTVVGNGLAYGGDGGVATSAQLIWPTGSAVDSSGNLFIADYDNCVVRKVAAGTGIISTVAGIGGSCGYTDNISATSAQLDNPTSVAVDSSGNLYIAEIARIRKVSGGIITTVAGNGQQGYNGDNISATSAELATPIGVAVDGSGNLYIADSYNRRIRKVSGGIITTVAGNGTSGYMGDNGSASSAELSFPTAITVDSSGNLYIADCDNNRIRKVSGGIITTVAGNGYPGYNGDNISATSAELYSPWAVAVDGSGNLYIADGNNDRIRKVTNGIITTIAGNGTGGYNGDSGIATSVELNSPEGVAVDSSGNVYVADASNNRIRKLTPPPTVNVTVTTNPSGLTVIVNGSSITTPQLFNWTPGSSHTFNASTQPGSAGTQYLPVGTFPVSQSFSTTQTFNINFTTQYYLTTAAGIGGTILPPSGWYNAGTGVSISATPATGYTLEGFTGALTGTANPQSITLNAPASVTANFTIPGNNILISGQVTAAGAALSGVTINVNGFQTLSTTSDAAGNYSILLGKSGAYTLAPSHAGYSFSAPVTFSNLTANQTANFTAIAVAGLAFYPVTPCRVADTRSGTGFSGSFGPPFIAAGTTRTFPIPLSVCAIPATAAAYSLNVTVVPHGYLGYLSIWPAGQPLPVVSTLNSYTGTVAANAAIVPAGANGAISIYVTDPTDVLFDINGYFAPPSGSGLQFYPVTPCRIADTRAGTGFSGALGPPSMAANTSRSFPIPLSACAIPSTAAAYSLNFTVVPPGPLGVLTAWPTGQSMPNVSTLNSYNGTVVANAAIVPAGTNGAISVYVNSSTDVLFDIDGYFAPPVGAGLNFYPVTPCRVADTRNGAGFSGPFGPSSLSAGVGRSFPVPSSICGIPASAGAYSLNFTAIPQGYLGLLTTWPTGSSMPNVSTLNSYNGTVVANAAIVPAGTGGAISIYVNNAADALFDINGYFAQ